MIKYNRIYSKTHPSQQAAMTYDEQVSCQRPHHLCPVRNNVEHIDHGKTGHGQVVPSKVRLGSTCCGNRLFYIIFCHVGYTDDIENLNFRY